MDSSLQTIEQFVSELSKSVKHSKSLNYEGVAMKLSNELALELIEKLQGCNTRIKTMLFDTEKLKTALAAMSINPEQDHKAYESKEAYMEWLKDYIEYEIVQPLEREAAEESGVDEYDCDTCENNEEARNIVIEMIANVESELF